jgi:hypothetical protein
MYEALPMSSSAVTPSWREIVWPKEHGSWSLALEPVALGLLVAPSWGGVALAVAVIAAFFSRRPLRTAVTDARAERRTAARRALDACGVVALVGGIAAIVTAGIAWSLWLLPTVLGGAVFLFFDLQKAGRESYAEVAGAAAFSWLPAAFAAAAGWPGAAAVALGLVMLARAVPTVLTVRSALRARKTGTHSAGLPVVAAILAVVVVAAFARAGLMPRTALGFVGLFAVRAVAWLVFPRTRLRASTIGMLEAALGVAFVLALAATWSR